MFYNKIVLFILFIIILLVILHLTKKTQENFIPIDIRYIDSIYAQLHNEPCSKETLELKGHKPYNKLCFTKTDNSTNPFITDIKEENYKDNNREIAIKSISHYEGCYELENEEKKKNSNKR